MKRFLGPVLSFLVVFSFSCTSDQVTMKAARDTWKVLCPEYSTYVKEDTKLTPQMKTTKLRTAELMTKVLEGGVTNE